MELFPVVSIADGVAVGAEVTVVLVFEFGTLMMSEGHMSPDNGLAEDHVFRRREFTNGEIACAPLLPTIASTNVSD